MPIPFGVREVIRQRLAFFDEATLGVLDVAAVIGVAAGGAGLGTMWGQELALKMISAAGFSSVEVERVEGDLMNNDYVARA